ncbi:hypothetical protein PHLCEN_2v12237 [Hermanssonia centrifuga]|uniref:Uncharacterized protein n=1 Tax=Hermanssonia centrifuga TaxID=98765 RepID=A0A2R6NHU2_9APHY|nr:hypothetical protein PHLCEN_2v12237 [Hermanssonia centrifuga]
MPSTYEGDEFAASGSRFLSLKSRKQPPNGINGRRSPSGSLRGSSLAQVLDDDATSARHSLAHELAVALMPEPSAGSKLLAEEFGIEYDEGAEGIDDTAAHTEGDPHPDTQDPIPDPFSGPDPDSEPTFAAADAPPDFDPAFDNVPPTPQRRSRLPEQDPMVTLAEDLESTEKFLSQLRRLDAGDQGGQPKLEKLASDVIRRIDDTVREREGQVRELLEYEREFRRIAGEIGGNDVLSQLDELDHLTKEPKRDDDTTRHEDDRINRPLDAIHEEPLSNSQTLGSGVDWEGDLDRDRGHLGDEEDEYEHQYSPSPAKTTFPSAPPPVSGPPTPATTIVQLAHFRTFTTSVASSLATISEQTQVNAAATTEAGRKIRALKNKLGGWRTEWDSAERSRAKIEKWEAGSIDIDGTVVVLPPLGTPPRSGRVRVDGRKIVDEHLAAFEIAIKEANTKTERIAAAMAAVSS